MEDNAVNKEISQPNEPETPYKGKRNGGLRIFNSFAAAALAEAEYDAKQLPADRIKETVELILRVYGVTRDELIAKRKKLHINIISGK